MDKKLTIFHEDGTLVDVDPVKPWTPDDVELRPEIPPNKSVSAALLLAQLLAVSPGAIGATAGRSRVDHRTAEVDSPTKKVKEESKSRRKMAAKSRNINRK